MIAEAFQWIENRLVGVEVLDLEDEQFVGLQKGQTVCLPPAEPLPDTLGFERLASLVGYVAENRDSLSLDRLLILVDTYRSVSLVGPLEGRHRQRALYATALAPVNVEVSDLLKGQWTRLDETIELLASAFLPTDDLAILAEALSKVSAKAEVRRTDDGLGQEVTIQSGQVSLGRQDVPSPCQLAPRLSFPEVTQLTHPYVVRLRADGDQIFVKLKEADGGEWKIKQVEQIKAKLETLLVHSKVGTDVPVLS